VNILKAWLYKTIKRRPLNSYRVVKVVGKNLPGDYAREFIKATENATGEHLEVEQAFEDGGEIVYVSDIQEV
jgi:hypothetical protein